MIERKAGFALLRARSYAEGFEHLAASSCDPREVLCLFAGLLPPSTTFRALDAPDHGLRAPEDMTQRDPAADARLRSALVAYLTVLRA